MGPLVRLAGISIAQLPPGGYKPLDSSPYPAGPELSVFVTSILSEAIPFIDGVAPKSGAPPTWKVKGSPKHYASSEAPVPLYERVVTSSELSNIVGMEKLAPDSKDETWFCRRSCHRNAAEKGTASWDEFVHAFRDNHPETEKAFTPTVMSARTATIWDTTDVNVEAVGSSWRVESLKVVEMTHKIDPKPLNNRTFPVLQLVASLHDTEEFLVTSIPLSDFERSEYAVAAKEKGLVVAAYTSIERIRILPAANKGGKQGEIEWIMATASDAKGVLPQWMQKLAVPGQVAHDVDLFLKWLPGERAQKDGIQSTA